MKNKLVELKKKELLSLVLAFTMAGSVAACKKNDQTVPTTSYTEPTSVTTTAETTVAPSETTVSTGLLYEEEANNFYDANEAFFINEYGEDREYAIKEINNAILVLTNQSETITNEDLRNTFYALDNMFMPTNVIQAAGNYITEEPIETVQNVPSLGRYIEDEQARTIINDNTAIINNFIDAMNNGTDEEKAAARNLVLQRVVLVEENLDEYYYLGELSNGDELALNMSNKGLVNLAGSLVQNGVLNYTDVNGVDQTMFLIADTRGAAILNTFRFAEEQGTPYDTQIITVDGVQTTVNGRYVEYLGPDGFVREFITLAEKNTIEDTLAITKYDEATVYIENEYSRISTEYYALNSDCEPTLGL